MKNRPQPKTAHSDPNKIPIIRTAPTQTWTSLDIMQPSVMGCSDPLEIAVVSNSDLQPRYLPLTNSHQTILVALAKKHRVLTHPVKGRP